MYLSMSHLNQNISHSEDKRNKVRHLQPFSLTCLVITYHNVYQYKQNSDKYMDDNISRFILVIETN